MHATRPTTLLRHARRVLCLATGVLTLAAFGPAARAAEGSATARFREEVQPILADYCFGCHAEGQKKGNVSFDAFASDEAMLADRDLWWNVLRNVRAGVMPPAKHPRPDRDDVRALEDWIKRDVFLSDPADPDPGRVTLRRLNRVEYRNTIRDLMGVEFEAELEFPPDDTGYGFDNIGDVLSVSPMLLEKYMQAAQVIVAEAVPTVSKVVGSETIPGKAFRAAEGGANGTQLTFYKDATVAHAFKAEQGGTYRLAVTFNVKGAFDFDPGRAIVHFKVDGRELLSEELGWQDGRKYRFEFREAWEPGEHQLSFELEPLTRVEKKKTSVDLRIGSVQVDGPLERDRWVHPKNFDRFFTQDAPASTEGRRAYAREVFRRFATRAFRRPVDDRTVKRLATIAEAYWEEPGKTFEEGVAQAMIAVLASPRFLFRIEESEPAGAGRAFPPVDEYALASRLSYFLWSTMPDEELFGLAERKELRTNLAAQVKRMLDDPKSSRLIENFTGQWLQARDIDGIAIDARTVLARDDGKEKEQKELEEEVKAFFAAREAIQKAKEAGETPPPAPKRPRLFFSKPRADLDAPLREAMRRETEMFFESIVREDRSVLDMLDCDYTFVNERLAKHYGIPDVKGQEMRKVTLPKDSPRGGLLTQGTTLIVTSNPTRTSPVKRGLFVLDNLVGMPPPPPPADIPQLEDAEKEFGDREPTLREVLELHRSKPLCNSCHSRMDPLGLALENFNALGMWREKERNQPLSTAGTLITGEKFEGIRELKRVLKEEHRADFYRCLTEKLLTYALGRGLEYHDVETVDRIVDRLDREQGKFSALLMGVIESAPFQKRRDATAVAASGRPGPTPTNPTPSTGETTR